MKNKKSNQSIIFLLSHQPNPRFVKQINFLSKKNNVTLIQFYRNIMNDLSSDLDSNIDGIMSLETLPDSLSSYHHYIQRIYKYILSIFKLRKIMSKRDADIVIVNNIDMFFLLKISMIFKSQKYKNVIEISDLLSAHEANNLKSNFFLFVEKKLFQKIDKLIVTSPKFYTEHYCKIFNHEHFILENKPLKSMLPKRLIKQDNGKKIIGIVGLLLQLDVYEYLFDTLKNNNDYEVHVYGMGKYSDEVENYSNKFENIKYFGPYEFFKDASTIYSKIDILYMPYSNKNKSLNNKLALPNKLYEAMYYKVPIITSENTYLSSRVKDMNIGVQVDYTNKILLLNSIEKIFKDHSMYTKNLESLNSELYFADQDYIALEKYLKREN